MQLCCEIKRNDICKVFKRFWLCIRAKELFLIKQIFYKNHNFSFNTCQEILTDPKEVRSTVYGAFSLWGSISHRHMHNMKLILPLPFHSIGYLGIFLELLILALHSCLLT